MRRSRRRKKRDPSDGGTSLDGQNVRYRDADPCHACRYRGSEQELTTTTPEVRQKEHRLRYNTTSGASTVDLGVG
jgi:hypothetical protein